MYTAIEKNTIVSSPKFYTTACNKRADPLLFDYLENALLWLDTQREIANFHILFLIKLTQFLGFYPFAENDECRYFNLVSGCFMQKYPNEEFIEGETVQHLKTILRHEIC